MPVALLALGAGLFGYRKWKDRQAGGDDLEDFAGTTTARPELSMPPPAAPPAVSDTARLRRPNLAGVDDKSGFVVEEAGKPDRGRLAAKAGAAASSDDTLSGETGINLDQGDPLAEADFHMAYGLYDQAADLVQLAIRREPDRRDLQLKLAEVYFVWGNREEFLRCAKSLNESVSQGAPGEWEKIVIMGKQIAPEDPLFSSTAPRAAKAAGGGGLASLDLALDGGDDGSLDFDLIGETPATTQTIETGVGTDFDFGAAARDNNAATANSMFDIGTADAATVMVNPGGGTTREMAPRFAGGSAAVTATLGTLDIDMGEAPTVEQPALRGESAGSPTIRQKLDAVIRQKASAADPTAELAIDDLGLDFGGDLEGLDHGDAAESADAPTMLAPLDGEMQRKMLEGRPARGGTDTSATAAMETLRVDLDEELLSGSRSGDTSVVAALDTSKFDTELDLPVLSTATGLNSNHRGNGVDLDIGSETQPDFVATERTASVAAAGPEASHTRDAAIGLSPLEPVTISEVGTKLDLARAYMDMGDPDGARSILKEVLHEGSMSQKQEAQRLMESLPG